MPDPIFADPRLAAIYDALDADRSDLDHYAAMIEEFRARRVLDVGCGTGSLAVMLAERGCQVVAVDPAEASLEVARCKRGAERIRWLACDATTLPPLNVDLAVMTGNVAQVFLSDQDWASALEGIRAALRPEGLLVFESRDPDRQLWREWTREQSFRRVDITGVGIVESCVDLLQVRPECVTFRWTFAFQSDGAVLTSDSTLRFRSRAALTDSLERCGFEVVDVRDAPDRTGRELVFIAARVD
jgi:ubiquinone/menaquinone biosynthesis C-methylase UbiE